MSDTTTVLLDSVYFLSLDYVYFSSLDYVYFSSLDYVYFLSLDYVYFLSLVTLIREFPDHACFREKSVTTGLVGQAWGFPLFDSM